MSLFLLHLPIKKLDSFLFSTIFAANFHIFLIDRFVFFLCWWNMLLEYFQEQCKSEGKKQKFQPKIVEYFKTAKKRLKNFWTFLPALLSLVSHKIEKE